MTWIVREEVVGGILWTRRRTITHAYDDPHLLLRDLLDMHRMGAVEEAMVAEIEGPGLLLDVLDAHAGRTVDDVVDDLHDAIAEALIRRGQGPVEGRDYVIDGETIARWQEVEE